MSTLSEPPVTEASIQNAYDVIEIRDGNLDIDAILKRVTESIQKKRDAGLLREEGWLSTPLDVANMPGSARQHADRLALLQMASRLELEGDPIRSHRPLLGPLVNLVKRVTRFWIRRYTDPIFLRQIHYNTELLEIVNDLNRQRLTLEERVAVLENQLRDANADAGATTETTGQD